MSKNFLKEAQLIQDASAVRQDSDRGALLRSDFRALFQDDKVYLGKLGEAVGER
jgi:hypothetical protein